MCLQWPFKRIIANANYRQSVHIIGNPYTSDTPTIVTGRFSFIVHVIQKYRNHTKITSRCMTTQSNYRQWFVSRDELVRGKWFFRVSRSDSGMAPPLLCPCSEKVDALWGLAGHKYNKVYLVESSLKLKNESWSSTRNNLCHTHHTYKAPMSLIDTRISDNWCVGNWHFTP